MMALDLFYPRFDVVRNRERCTLCGACISQCANGVHSRAEDGREMLADPTRCVNCQRCVALCPNRALKIVKRRRAAAYCSPAWAIPRPIPFILTGCC